MDVTFLRSSLYELPSNLRVDALVHDGAADLQLWPGPGADTELKVAWGDGLQRALDAEARQIPNRRLPVGGVLRMTRGRLHCDFLAWVASREPEPGAERSPAPSAELLRECVKNVLEFVSTRHVERVAFHAIGAGPGELERATRLVEIVRAAQAYQDACAAEGRAPGIEEVLVCESDPRVYKAAAVQIRGIARIKEPAAVARDEAPKKVVASTAKAKSASSAAGGSKRRGAPRLAEEDVSRRRFTAAPYDMRHRYGSGEWLLHPRFGVGRVEMVTPEGSISVLFEDGEIRKMVHART